MLPYSSNKNSGNQSNSIVKSIYFERKKSFNAILDSILTQIGILNTSDIVDKIDNIIISNIDSERETFLMDSVEKILQNSVIQKSQILESMCDKLIKIAQKYSHQQFSLQKKRILINDKKFICLTNQQGIDILAYQIAQLSKIQCDMNTIRYSIIAIHNSFLSDLDQIQHKIRLKSAIEINKYKSLIEQLNFQLKIQQSQNDQRKQSLLLTNSKSKSYSLIDSPIKQKTILKDQTVNDQLNDNLLSTTNSPNQSSIQMAELCNEIKESDKFQQRIISKNKKLLDYQRKLEAEILAKNKEIEELKFCLDAKNAKIAMQRGTIKLLENEKKIPHQVIDVVKELKAKNSEIEQLKNQLEDQNKKKYEIKKLKRLVSRINNENEQFKQIISTEQEKVSMLQNEKASLNQLIVHLKNEMKEIELKSNNMKVDFEHISLINETTHKNNEKLSRQIESYMSEINDKRKELQNAKNIIDKQREKLNEIEKANKHFKDEIQQKNEQINQLIKVVNNFSSKQNNEKNDSAIKKIDSDIENLNQTENENSIQIEFESESEMTSTDTNNLTEEEEEEDEVLLICTSCQKPINDKSDVYFYAGDPYHEKCVKCATCQKQTDDLIRVNQTTFLCKEHFDECKESNEIPEEIAEEYHKQTKENIVKLFDTPTFSEEELKNYKEEDIFAKKEMTEDSFNVDQPFEYFVPSGQFHFDKDVKELDIDKFYEIIGDIGDDLVITDIQKGSTLLKLAFIGMKKISSNLKESFNSVIKAFKEKITSPFGKAVVGNFVEEKIIMPDEKKIQELYNKPSINILQSCDKLNETDINDIKEEVFKKLDNVKKNDWNFLISHEDLFDQFEQQVKENILNNAIEMVVIGHTVIANKYIENYREIKSKIPENEVLETFMYHGSALKNHMKIVNQNFLMPGKHKMSHTTDAGYFGKGIYATDNLFYASIYGNRYKILKQNEKTCVMVCRTVYNQSKVKNITDKSFYGETISDDIANNYGIHHALVGNKKQFWTIKEEEIEKNSIVANEFVFPNEYQIFPLLSIMVMRTDHLIIWKDDHIDNEENSKYHEEAKKIEVNFYAKESNSEALKLINLKKFNRIKLITNGGEDNNGRDLIIAAREILRSNFVCLVFALSLKHAEWVTKMENVLLTNNPEDFRKFVKLKMNKTEVLKFIQHLEEELDVVKFKINEEELLNFPLAEQFDNDVSYMTD